MRAPNVSSLNRLTSAKGCHVAQCSSFFWMRGCQNHALSGLLHIELILPLHLPDISNMLFFDWKLHEHIRKKSMLRVVNVYETSDQQTAHDWGTVTVCQWSKYDLHGYLNDTHFLDGRRRLQSQCMHMSRQHENDIHIGSKSMICSFGSASTHFCAIQTVSSIVTRHSVGTNEQKLVVWCLYFVK